jgi:hypothetical protein
MYLHIYVQLDIDSQTVLLLFFCHLASVNIKALLIRTL